LWVGPENYVGDLTLIFLGLYGIMLSCNHINGALAVATNRIKYLPLLSFMEAIFNIGFSIILAKMIGVSGIALGTLLSSFLTSFLFAPLAINHNYAFKYVFAWKSIFLIFIRGVFPILTAYFLILDSTLINIIWIKIFIFLIFVSNLFLLVERLQIKDFARFIFQLKYRN